LPNTFPLRASGGSVGRVLFVSLRASHLLLGGGFLANFCASQFANVRLDCAGIDQTFDDRLRTLIHAAAVEGAVDKRRGLATIQCEKLRAVALDFLLGDLQDGFDYLRLIILSPRSQRGFVRSIGHRMVEERRMLGSKIPRIKMFHEMERT